MNPNPEAPADVVGRLRATFTTGRTRDLAWRRAQLHGLIRLIEENKLAIAAAVAADLRRGEVEAVLFDIGPVKSEAAYALKHLRSWTRPRRVSTPLIARPGKARVVHEPLGVVLVVAPWNYPVHLALVPLAAALAAGNCVVVKPSEMTPTCATVMAELLPRYLDPEAVAVVEGAADVTHDLLAADVDHCFFTGSPTVGRAVMRAAAEHLTPVTLELGGKCPAVVTPTARLDVAARRIAWGKTSNSGQTCVAPDYVLVDGRVRDAFVRELVDALRTFTDDGPLPIVNQMHARRLAGLGSGTGGRTVLGGGVDVDAATAEATVVVDPDPDAALLREEIFGPIVPVVTVDSLDAAITHIRRGTRPLAGYLFTEDDRERARFVDEVVAGGVVTNHVMVHLGVPELPFGGVGTSGTGRYHGRWGFETFSNPKAVLEQSSRFDLPLLYPPYRRWKRRLLAKV